MDGDTKNTRILHEAALRPVSLADKYDLETPDVFVSGTQALVRLCLLQAEIDRRAGLNTAGYVSGYRGSPLGSIDLQFEQATNVLEAANVTFAPALNEDLAATALWGTQQANLHGEGKYDGVFGIWYGKGPGVDRTGDVFRHANLAGTADMRRGSFKSKTVFLDLLSITAFLKLSSAAFRSAKIRTGKVNLPKRRSSARTSKLLTQSWERESPHNSYPKSST